MRPLARSQRILSVLVFSHLSCHFLLMLSPLSRCWLSRKLAPVQWLQLLSLQWFGDYYYYYFWPYCFTLEALVTTALFLSVSHFVWCKTAWTGAFCVWLRLLQNVMARKMGKTFVQRIKYAFAFISLSLCCVRGAPFSLFTIFLALVSPKIRSFRIFFRLCGALQTTCFDDEIEIFIVCYSSRTELKWNTMPLVVTVSLKCRWMAITFLSRLASASHRKCTMYIPLLLLKYSNVWQSEIDAKLTAQFVPTPAFIHPHKFQFGAVQINY